MIFKRKKAFSLLELLVVIAIIGIISVATTLSFQSIGRSQQLGASVRGLEETIGNARRKAIAANRVVEFRLRKDATGSGYSSYDAVVFDEFGATTTPVIRVQTLPVGFSFATDSRSSLMTLAETTTTSPPSPALTYRSFRFQPDGSTDLSSSQLWYLTVVHISATSPNSPDVASLTIHPTTGAVTTFRP
jgi:uncharacterized protein (TIGR02596 family)